MSGPADDLALVQSCLTGDEGAWTKFVDQYREKLFKAALAMTRNDSLARELTDSLWADLYGTYIDSHGKRISKLTSYHGLGSLDGWLRALLAQEYVSRQRRERRFVGLEENFSSAVESAEIGDPRLNSAIEKSLSDLNSEQRLLVSAHYLDGRTLAEIGKMLGLHESTVSRRLSKATKFVRKRTLHYLRGAGMSMREAQDAISCNVRDISVDIRNHLQPVKDLL